MSARRTPSTTSLSKYARQNSPVLQNRSLDFCNAFWGLADGGVDVLFARMRGAGRTIEELKNFWKERCVSCLYRPTCWLILEALKGGNRGRLRKKVG